MGRLMQSPAAGDKKNTAIDEGGKTGPAWSVGHRKAEEA